MGLLFCVGRACQPTNWGGGSDASREMRPLARKGEERAEKCGCWQRFRANGRICRLTYAGVEKGALSATGRPLVTPVG